MTNRLRFQVRDHGLRKLDYRLYPDGALVAFRSSAAAFSSIQVRAFLVTVDLAIVAWLVEVIVESDRAARRRCVH